jgi:hypothetical protein
MPEPTWRKAGRLVEETQQNVESQRAIIADLEKRGLDATFARKDLAMLEETLVRRMEIANQFRAKHDKKKQ